MNDTSKLDQRVYARPDETSVSAKQIEQALICIASFLRQHHDTHAADQLRRFVWSLWNGDHYLNLCTLGRVLDASNSEAVAIVFLAYMRCMLTESHLEWVLTNSGEMSRFKREAEESKKVSISQPVDYPPMPTHIRRLCRKLGPIAAD
jgi:hypothetical protein